MKIDHLRVNHLTNPVGFEISTPVFSWIVSETEGKKQEAARVMVAYDNDFREIYYDSGFCRGIDSLSFMPELTLFPCTRYYWKVFVRTDVGEQGESGTAFFETGRMDEPWSGRWIKPPFSRDIHPVFFKEIELIEEIAQARVYASGLGLFELYLNGEKVSDEYLTPFYNDYNYWVQYVTFDVTKKLQAGKNSFCAMLGNGWYKGRFGFVPDTKELYGNEFLFLFQLEIIYKNKTRVVIGSDETWKCIPSPVVESSIYDGEVYDARRENREFLENQYGKKIWDFAVPAKKPLGVLKERLSLPVNIMERRKPVCLIHTPAGEQVLDFGQIMTGWVEFRCSLSLGDEIILEFGELLQDGNFYQENLRTAKQRFIYISDGTKRLVRPHFTFYGFRYVRVTGVTVKLLDDFMGCVIYSQLEETGNIVTSNTKVNKLVENTKWGQKGNFLDIPTDCPQRDERMGWTGDAQVFCGTASYHMYTPAFYRKYLRDFTYEQRNLGGSVPYVVPDALGQIEQKRKVRNGNLSENPHGSCVWGDAATIIPWSLYLFFGDRSLLKEEYENMKGWVDFIHKQEEEKCGGRGLWTCGFHFADWLALDNPDKSSSLGGTDCYYVASVYYYYSVCLLVKAAKVLDMQEDICFYRALSEKIKKAVRREYFSSDGELKVDTQTAYVLALKFHIAPREYRGRMAARLLQKLQEKEMHLDTGFTGTPHLCSVLTEEGMVKEAYSLLLNEDFPGWLYEINMGATTVWERWNSLLPDGKVSDTGMNSMNHYAYGSIAEWMYRYMCGLNPCEEKPGFKRARIEPYPDKRLQWARAVYHSPAGEYSVSWNWEGESLNYRIRVPFDCEALFVLNQHKGNVFVNGIRDESLEMKGSRFFIAGDYEISVK